MNEWMKLSYNSKDGYWSSILDICVSFNNDDDDDNDDNDCDGDDCNE